MHLCNCASQERERKRESWGRVYFFCITSVLQNMLMQSQNYWLLLTPALSIVAAQVTVRRPPCLLLKILDVLGASAIIASITPSKTVYFKYTRKAYALFFLHVHTDTTACCICYAVIEERTPTNSTREVMYAMCMSNPSLNKSNWLASPRGYCRWAL